MIYRGWGRFWLGGVGREGGRGIWLFTPSSRHQLADRAANGPPSVHHFTIQTNGLACFPHLVNTEPYKWLITLTLINYNE